jgi:hypothetical protein
MRAAPIEESKRAFRQKLAHLPIAEKLRMLDQLRLRTIAIKRRDELGHIEHASARRTAPKV